MMPMHSYRYHPNSYIASRRSSLPRQGYGGVYERRVSLAGPLTPSPSTSCLREGRHGVLPRPYSDFSLGRTAADLRPPESASESSADLTPSEEASQADTSCASSASPESCGGGSEVVAVEKERPATPPLTLPAVTVRWRQREAEEVTLMEGVMRTLRRRGREPYLASMQLSRLVTEMAGLEVEEEVEEMHEDSSFSADNDEESVSMEWNNLIFNLVSRKKRIRAVLDKEYRDSKRQASQMRQTFERCSDQVVSRFDRLISDILCYARLVCHLARQSARFGKEGSSVCSDLNSFIEEKRNVLKQQLAELPRLRHSLLLRQASLIRMCTDDSTQEALQSKFSAYWSYALQLCVIDSEIVLDNELTE